MQSSAWGDAPPGLSAELRVPDSTRAVRGTNTAAGCVRSEERTASSSTCSRQPPCGCWAMAAGGSSQQRAVDHASLDPPHAVPQGACIMAQLARRLCCARAAPSMGGCTGCLTPGPLQRPMRPCDCSGRCCDAAPSACQAARGSMASAPRRTVVRSPLASPARAPGPGPLSRRCTLGPSTRASASWHSARVRCCGLLLCLQPPLHSADRARRVASMPDGHAPARCMPIL